MDPSKLVFIDETWATTHMTRLRGRALRGRRLVAKGAAWTLEDHDLIAALDHNGMRCATVVDGAINHGIFESFVESVLVPRLTPGDVMVMVPPVMPKASKIAL